MAQDLSLLEFLPVEILLLIFSYLPRVDREHSCALVCRSWRTLILSGTPLQVPPELLSKDSASQAALIKCLNFVWNKERSLHARIRDHHLESTEQPSQLAAQRLSSVNLSRTRFFQTPALALCTSLQALDLSATPVRDLLPLRSLAASLTTLNLSATKADNYSAILPHLRKLRSLDLSRTPITDMDVEALDELIALEEINLSHTHITLVPCGVALKVLNVSNTAVASLEPLAACQSLQRLDISHTRVERVWALLWCKRLEDLRCLGIEATDMALLLQHSSLRTVTLPHTPVSDMYTLKNCPFLLYCGLHGSIRVL